MPKSPPLTIFYRALTYRALTLARQAVYDDRLLCQGQEPSVLKRDQMTAELLESLRKGMAPR